MGDTVKLERGDEALRTREPFALADSDLDDSFLQKVAEQPLLVPMPVLGERLGGLEGSRYEILELLGRGGMGQVFRALDHELLRTVALKFLLSFLRLSPLQVTEAVREEAQATARLEHDNIVRIYDVSLWNTGIRSGKGVPALRIPFLVMEHLQGESLRSLLQRERLDLRRILEILLDVSAGLAHAHERHLVHLDLKPGNVFILSTGRAKLLDFGLSRLLIGPHTELDSSGFGTPPYMSPQRWGRTPPQPRDDVWSCGILLFEMLTGQLPFPELNPHALRARTLSAAPMPSVRERRPELPEEVDRFVASTLEKVPEKRPADGSEMLKHLCALQERLALRPERPRVHAERRQVTLVACRLQLAPDIGQLDSEDFSELEAAFHRACTHIVHLHGGAITTAVGIEVLACFGYPRVQEEDAEHAVRAALQQHQQLPGELSCQWHHGLSVKIGIHTDMVALANVMPEFHGAAPAMQGEGPRIASWLAGQSEPDTVLLSDQTHALVRGRFQTRALGQRTFEGLMGARSIGVHQVLHELRNVTRFDRALVMGPLTPLVGRERELKRLARLREEALHEHGVFVLLRGEAGIGKSRLVQELHDRELPGASTWARCQCWPQYKSSVFYPLIDWLQRFLELAPQDAPPQKLRTLAERLSAYGLPPEYGPPLAALLSLPLPEDSSFLLLPPERQREQGVQALSALLQRLSQKRPLVFVVEDVHWADPSTLQFLGFLLAHLERTRLCVLLTTRSTFTHDWADHPGFHELRLPPLSPEATTRLVRETAQGRTLSAGTVEKLVTRSDGIPLFIEEMTRMMLEHERPAEPTPEGGMPPIPATLQELLLARLDQLPPRTKALAQLAALLGREFSHDVLRAVSFLEEEELRRDLEQLEQARLLFQQGWPPQLTYAFKHALVQDAAYQSLPRSTRQHFHTRIFHVLSERFPAMRDEQPELLAHHASRAGLAAQAVALWRRAGQRAGAKSALSEAITHFTRALEQLALLPSSHERDEQEIALQIELGQALISTKGYTAREVEEAYTRARVLCERYGDTPASVVWGIWVVTLLRGEREETDRLITIFQHLAENSDDSTTVVLSHGVIAGWCFWRGAYAEAARHGAQVKEALRRDRSLGDVSRIRGGGIQSYVSEQLLHVQLFEAFSECMWGHMGRAREGYQQALAMAEAHPYAVGIVLSFCASIEYEAGEPETARDLANRLISVSAGNGFPFNLALGYCVQGWATAELGDVNAGIAIIQQGLGLLRAMGTMMVYPTCLGCLLKAQLRAGQLAEGMAAVEEGLRLLETLMSRRALTELLRLRGELLLRRGETEAARASLEQARVEAHDSGAMLHELRAALVLARLLRQSGETHEARVLLSEILDRFTGDHDLRDYKAARQLLAELSSEPEPPPAIPPA